MHLLAAQPGGFVDDEGIIDLQQTPAEIVILSATDNNLMALAHASESLQASFPSIRLANWLQLKKPAAFDLYQHTVIDHCKVVVLSLLGGQSYWQYAVDQLQLWQQQDAQRVLIIVPGDDNDDPQILSPLMMMIGMNLKMMIVKFNKRRRRTRLRYE